MFSRRVGRDLTPNRIFERLTARGREGLLDLTESNPTRVGLHEGADLLGALADPRAMLYEPAPRGLASARRAIAEDYGRRGVELDPERILLTSGTSDAYGYLFKLLADPGATILAPQPSYPLFDLLATLEAVRIVPYPLVYENAWHIDLDALGRAAHDAAAIVLVHPNNPTGSFVKPVELDALRALGAPLVSDEVFVGYAHEAPPLPTLAGERDRLTFVLGGLSKSAGLPQLKLGWIYVAGPEAEAAAALERLELIADTYLAVGTPVQWALPSLLAYRPIFEHRLRDRLAAHAGLVDRHFGPSSGSPARVLTCEGGWYAVLRVPATRTEEEWVLELLDRDHVLVHPGYFFDFPEEAYLVLSLLPPTEIVTEALGRLARRLSS